MTLRELKNKAKAENLAVCPVAVSTAKLSLDRVCNDVLYQMLRKLKTNRYDRFKLTQFDADDCFHIVLSGDQASVIVDALDVYNDALNDYFADEIAEQLSDTIKGFCGTGGAEDGTGSDH